METPPSKRRLQRRLADPNTPVELIREAYRAYLYDLKGGNTSLSGAEKQKEIANTEKAYSSFVQYAGRYDSKLPMASEDVIPAALNGQAIPRNGQPAIKTPSASLPDSVNFQYPRTGKYAQSGTPYNRTPVTQPQVADQTVKAAPLAASQPTTEQVAPISVPRPATRTRTLARALAPAVNNPSKVDANTFLPPAGGDTNPVPTQGSLANFSPIQPPKTSLSGTINRPVVAPAPTAPVPTSGSGDSSSPTTGQWIQGVSGLAQLLIGAMGAGQKLPAYQMPYEWQLYGQRLKALSNQGLDPISKAQAENDLMRNFDNTMATTRALTGGGGSSAEAAANAIDASGRLAQQYIGLAKLDNETRKANLGPYDAYLRTNLSLDQQDFARNYNQAAQAQNNYANMAVQGLQSLVDAPYQNSNQDLWEQYLQGIGQQRRLTQLALNRKTEL